MRQCPCLLSGDQCGLGRVTAWAHFHGSARAPCFCGSSQPCGFCYCRLFSFYFSKSWASCQGGFMARAPTSPTSHLRQQGWRLGDGERPKQVPACSSQVSVVLFLPTSCLLDYRLRTRCRRNNQTETILPVSIIAQGQIPMTNSYSISFLMVLFLRLNPIWWRVKFYWPQGLPLDSISSW